jgi:hypothetical protein
MNLSAFWKSLPGWAKGVVVVVVIAALYFALWNPLKIFFAKQKAKAKQKEYDAQQITLPNGATFNAGSVAAEVFAAFYDNDIQGVPAQYIGAVESAYLSMYNKVLRDDLLSFLSASQWNSVKHLFN